jgi:hypothetical protein
VYYVASNGMVTVNDELERMWKKVIMACFMVLSQNLPGGIEENCDK